MFKIEPVQDKARQKELCTVFGTEYIEDYFGYYMYDIDSGTPMGFSQFEISGEFGYIRDLKAPNKDLDHEAMFILGRQTMNFIDLCGAHLCYCSEEAGNEKLISSIGFKLNSDGKLFCDMTGMFDGHCHN